MITAWNVELAFAPVRSGVGVAVLAARDAGGAACESERWRRP